MYSAAKKLRLIEEMLKVRNHEVLNEIEKVLISYTNNVQNKASIYDYVGIISEKEATEMKLAIEEVCETIDENEWK